MKSRLRKIKDATNPKKSFVKRTGELTPTNIQVKLDKVVDPGDYDDDTANYVALVERLAPRVINRPVKAVVIDDPDAGIRGCFEFHSGEMHINLDCHDTSDNASNYWLMIHEFAHNTVNSNAHLKDVFYKTEEEIAGKLLVRTTNRGRVRPHNAETDWACCPNRDSAEFAAAIRHCASSTHGIRAMSCRVNPEVTVLANQTFGYCLRSIVS